MATSTPSSAPTSWPSAPRASWWSKPTTTSTRREVLSFKLSVVSQKRRDKRAQNALPAAQTVGFPRLPQCSTGAPPAKHGDMLIHCQRSRYLGQPIADDCPDPSCSPFLGAFVEILMKDEIGGGQYEQARHKNHNAHEYLHPHFYLLLSCDGSCAVRARRGRYSSLGQISSSMCR